MMRRSRLAGLVCAVTTASCATGPTRDHGHGATTAVERDTETACARTHDAGAWTQLVFLTQSWQDLARRADARDPDAWEEIADRVQSNLRRVDGTTCRKDMLADLRASATRLRAER